MFEPNLCRFCVFGGDCYYAEGGFNDFRGAFVTLDDALFFAKTEKPIYKGSQATQPILEWWHVFDFEEKKVVAFSDCQAYGAKKDFLFRFMLEGAKDV